MNRLRIITLAAALLALPALAACGGDDDDDEPTATAATATTATRAMTGTATATATAEGPHLAGATVMPSGLEYVDEVVGTGDPPALTDQVTVHYTGKLAETGEVFDSTEGGQPYTLELNRFIPGFTEGVATMKVGGKRTLYIPSELAYRDRPPRGSGIPENADLIFEVELVAIK